MTIRIECSTYEELVEVARNILGREEAPAVSTTPAIVRTEPVSTPKPVTEEPEPVMEEISAAEEKTYTQPEVRKFLGELRKAGKKEAVTALISSMGYSRFTDIPEERFGELMEKAREL